MASGGYPGKYKKGIEISGIDAANRMRDVVVFHAGTRLKGKKVLSDGGRVLGVTALGDTVDVAIKKAYQQTAKHIYGQCSIRKTGIPGNTMDHSTYKVTTNSATKSANSNNE